MDQYLKNAILTASPAKLIEMLYDQIIELIQKAIANIENNEKRNNILLRAQDMTIYLMSILDDQKGGQIAKNLRELYDFVYRSLVEGNIHKDPKKLEEAMEIMKGLLETWKEVEKKAGQKSNVNFELSV
ncbi:flagellar export chaperone FliS [Athalassotoga saccharophila]|uniref:flagellar export chaperone FliS n=1 Tax=Athalassotoga saccharophila TaxID=1441386 RepID=UPI00137A19F3|nr:flagellar export chaperone FliS [Athalassotoga saccharophila]BBJ27938.1 flagellar secretion chaperone FliS [Athalassotoga saccharophila]